MEHYSRTLQTDCGEILRRFQAVSSVRFEEFSAIWREMNFSSVFHGISGPSQRRTFTRLALSTACPFLHPPYAFQIRVGGLYLLYGLYNAQPITPKEKIWLALKDWSDLMRFQQDALEAQHFDIVYILKKLQSDRAFCFTAMPKMLFYKVKKKLVDRMPPPCDSFVDRPSRPQELINSNLLEELNNVHEHYEELKKATVKQANQSDTSLISQNLVPKLRNSVLTFYNWQQIQADFENQSEGDPGEGTSSQDESARRAQLLASIKSKSYGHAVEASRSRRHRQIEISSDTEDTKCTQKRKRPVSLKERTEAQLITQGKLKEELHSATRLWCLTQVENMKSEVAKKKRRFKWKESYRNKR